MDKRKEIVTCRKIVQDILERNPAARGDDKYLLRLVYEEYCPGISHWTFGYVMSDNGLILPHFETVRRVRRKLQAERPELKPDPVVEEFRGQYEDIYREMMRDD